MREEQLYQHFKFEERFFVKRIVDLANRVEQQYVMETTEYLDPRQVAIIRSIVGQYDLNLFVSSDYYPMEYAKVIISPEYYELDESDFEISLVDIHYNAKFAQLNHAQIMGTLLNQLGIKRHLIGDILISEGRAQVFVDKGIVSYLIANTEKIARVGVTLREIALDQLMVPQVDSKQKVVLSTSLRLDKIIAEVLSISRTNSLSLIESGKVKLNYALTTNTSQILEIDDLISVRGFGRFKVLENQGFTKNGKHKLLIETIIHK